jgi:hypothetical protein
VWFEVCLFCSGCARVVVSASARYVKLLFLRKRRSSVSTTFLKKWKQHSAALEVSGAAAWGKACQLQWIFLCFFIFSHK